MSSVWKVILDRLCSYCLFICRQSPGIQLTEDLVLPLTAVLISCPAVWCWWCPGGGRLRRVAGRVVDVGLTDCHVVGCVGWQDMGLAICKLLVSMIWHKVTKSRSRPDIRSGFRPHCGPGHVPGHPGEHF